MSNKRVLFFAVLYAMIVIFVFSGCQAADTIAIISDNGKQGYTFAAYDELSKEGKSFLLCGTNGRLDRIFEDGTLKNIPLPADGKDLAQVLVGTDIVLVGGSSGTLLYSKDGMEFRPADGVGKGNILRMAQFKEKYYACTYEGDVLTSDDGISWKSGKRLIGKPLIAVAASESRIIAITNDTDIFTSEDGESWTQQNYNEVYKGLSDELSFTNLMNLNGNFILIGHPPASAGIPVVMVSSSGGEVWSTLVTREINKRAPEDYFPITVSSVSYFGGNLLAACDNGRVLTYSDCPSCSSIINTSTSTDLRCMAGTEELLIVAGDDYKFEVLTAEKLRPHVIKAEQAQADMDTGAIMIDVRTDDEYNQGHIPGALHIPVDEIKDRLSVSVPDKESELIFYCAAGVRAQAALETALELGYQNVFNMGGLSDWPYDIE